MATKTFTAKTKGEWVQLSTLINFDFVDGKDYTLQVLGTAKFGDDGKTGILIDSTTPYTYTHKSGVDLYVMTENEDGAVITVSDSASLALATRGGGSGGGSGDAVWGAITGTLSDQTDLANALAEKQDTLTAGTGISISDNVISATGGSVSFDGTTINENASNELQAIGVIDKNSGDALGFWHGTAAEYSTTKTYYDWECVGFSSVSLPTSADWYDVTYGNGIWLLVARNSSTALYSNDDGANWSSVTMPTSTLYVWGAYGDGTFVVVSQDGYAAYSTDDCETWTNVAVTGTWQNIAFGNHTFVAVSSNNTPRVSYSTDNGATWTAATTFPTIANDISIRAIAYGDGTFVITGRGSENPTDFAAYSDDNGDTWTAVTLPSAQYNWASVAYGNGTFVAVSQSNKAAYSTDKGRTWTEVTLPFSANWTQITFGNGVFAVVQSTMKTPKPLIYSADGIHWSQTSFNVSTSMSICYGNDKFLISHESQTNATAISMLSAYTDTDTPTTESTVYSDTSGTISALTITAVGTGTITLSDTNTYDYNASGNVTVTQTIGDLHPNYLCNIDGVGLKIGDTDIANLASYSAFTGADGSVAGSAGLVPAPTATDNDKYLKGDGTWAAVSGGSGLQNEATAANSISILGGDTIYEGSLKIGEHALVDGINAIAIGCEDEDYNGTYADDFATAIGGGTYANKSSVAIGFGSGTGNYSIALNASTTNEKEFVVGYNDRNGNDESYLLLDLATGKIPNDRIDGATGSFTSQDGKTVTVTNGVITDIS